MLGYVIFIVGVEKISNGITCTGIAALLQFFFLATWCWMCVYSYDLYIALVEVSF